MKDTREIVLFFDENIEFTPINIAQDIISRYPELGSPIILPVSNNKKAPLIIFNENPDIQIQSNFNNFTIVFNHKYFDKTASIIFDIVDTFENIGIKFIRMGMVASVFLSPKYVDKCKNRYLNMDNVGNVDEINLSWYFRLSVKDKEINAWERLITDSKHFNDLLCQYDFNTPIGERIDLDMKYIKEFISVATNFIESRLDY